MPTIIRATRADYAAIQRFLEEAYNHAPDFFPLHYPWCWREENTDYAHTYLIGEAAQIASLVRVFPLNLSLGGIQAIVGGIGGVSTHPTARGKGYMSQLLSHAIDRMKAENMPVSILWGDRHRYESFGYQTAGKAITVTVSRRGLDKARVEPLEPVRFQGQPELFAQIMRAYHAHAFHRVRTPDEFRVASRHPDLLLFCAGENDHFGYVGLMHGALVEYGGNMPSVLALATNLMARFGRAAMDFRFPRWKAIPKLALAAATGWRVEPTGQIKILDLEKTITCFGHQTPGAMIPTLEHLQAMSAVQQVETLFGTAHNSPFNILVWPLDNI